ncbi:MAG: TetR/AcrR family transcriptional regulator [Cypionkella sp.]
MEKRCAILNAGLKLFAARGMDGVPMEAIAAEAGVSKVTVYANFKDKNAIIAELVDRQSDLLDDILAEAMQTEGSLAEKLTRVGTALFELLAEPSHQAIERCLSMEKLRNPELARQYFKAGPGHLRDRLAELMADAMECGAVNLDCSRMAAEDLLGLWLGFSAVERRYTEDLPSDDYLRERVKRGVEFFMRSHAA